MPLFNPPPAASGGSALDANNNLLLPAPTAATTPAAGAIAERVITRAGFSQLAYANVDLPDLSVMPGLESFTAAWVEPNSSNAAFATGGGAVSSGTATAITPTFTTYTNSRNLHQFATSTTAGTAAIIGINTLNRYRGNGARRGGFYVVVRFNPVLASGHQALAGLLSDTSNLAGEPSANSGAHLGLLADSTDTNWQMFSKPAGSAGTKIDTGLSKTVTCSITVWNCHYIRCWVA